jgi:hypothetical protein
MVVPAVDECADGGYELLTEVKDPRRMAWRVMTEKKHSRLIHEHPVGVKCRVIRWFSRLASHVRTAACLWVE